MRSRLYVAAAVLFALVGGGSASAQEKLVVTTMSPAGTKNFRFFDPWAKRVEEQSKGTLSITLAPFGPLANYGNVYQRVQDDVVQVGWLLVGAAAGQFPLTDVGSLPFLLNDASTGSVAIWRTYKAGLLDTEHRDILPLYFIIFPPNVISYSKKPAMVDSMSGLKVAANSRWNAVFADKLGGTPISLQVQEYYEGMQRGTIDAIMVGWGAFSAFKLAEVSVYHIEGPLGSSTAEMFMSKKRFNALPEAARKALEDNGGESGSLAWGAFFDQGVEGERNGATSQGKHEVITLSGATEEAWRKRVEPVQDEWARAYPNGPQVLATFKKMVADFTREKKK